MQYSVLITQDCTESATIIVNAKNKEGAVEQARILARNDLCTWISNGPCSDWPYMAGDLDEDVQELQPPTDNQE